MEQNHKEKNVHQLGLGHHVPFQTERYWFDAFRSLLFPAACGLNHRLGDQARRMIRFGTFHFTGKKYFENSKADQG